MRVKCGWPECQETFDPFETPGPARKFCCRAHMQRARYHGIKVEPAIRPAHTCACGAHLSRRETRVCRRCRGEAQQGPNNPAWKGGRSLTGGYVRILRPDHPRAVKGKYVLEHIVVMETTLGRYLHTDEEVHHMNGIKDDNRPENLELWVKPQPTGIRAADAVTWAEEILRRYSALDSL